MKTNVHKRERRKPKKKKKMWIDEIEGDVKKV